MICECSAGVRRLVERSTGRDLLPKAKASRFDDWPHLDQKRSTSFVRKKPKHYSEDNRPVPRIRISLQDFATFNESQIAIELGLKKQLKRRMAKPSSSTSWIPEFQALFLTSPAKTAPSSQ